MKPSRSWFSWKILLSLLVEENGEILRKLLSMCEISSGQLTIHASLLRPTKIRRLMVGFIKGYSFQISGTRASLNILRCMLKTTWLTQYLLDISEEQKLRAIHRLAYCFFFFFLAVLFFDLAILYCVCFFAILILSNGWSNDVFLFTSFVCQCDCWFCFQSVPCFKISIQINFQLPLPDSFCCYLFLLLFY